jgi:hypothetical protein
MNVMKRVYFLFMPSVLLEGERLDAHIRTLKIIYATLIMSPAAEDILIILKD